MKLKKLLIYTQISLLFFSAQQGFAKTDIQTVLTSPRLSRSQLTKQLGLTRLWAFEDSKTLFEDTVLIDGSNAQRSVLINKGFNVYPKQCGDRTYAYFNNGMIESDETLLIEKILTAVKPSKYDERMSYAKKAYSHLRNDYPNILPSFFKGDTNQERKRLVEKQSDTIASEENRQAIQKTSSLIEAKKDSHGGFFINSTDYTVGGWFKPSVLEARSSKSMTLFTKKTTNTFGKDGFDEWKIFVSGNNIFFHNYRNANALTTGKYLSKQEAVRSRNQHADFYSATDYYDDVVQKPVFGHQKAVPTAFSILPKIFVDMAIVPDSKKPVTPVVPRPPPVSPVTPPEVIPRPPGPIPFPNYPLPIPINPGGNGIAKEYTSNIDLKNFWWATEIGSCYQCLNAGHSEAWYYLSFSVHLNDPLGPYVDLVVIQDPNEKVFGNRPTVANNLRTARWELDRDMLSRPALNPVQNTEQIEKGCADSSCAKSTLEIGSVDANSEFQGYMRGVYIAKKAFHINDMIEMAAQFYPNDSAACTYNGKAK